MVLIYGVRDYSLPVQQWAFYEMCPMQISLGGMLLLQTALRFQVYELSAVLAGFFAVLFRRALAADALGALLCAGGLLWHMTYILRLQTLTEAQQRHFAVLRAWLPQSLLHPYSCISGVDCVNLLESPVSRVWLCAGICLACTAWLLTAAYRLCGRRER